METKYHVEYNLPDDNNKYALDWLLWDTYSLEADAMKVAENLIKYLKIFRVNVRIIEITKREVGMFIK